MTDIAQPIRIGVVGVAGRGGMARHWHQPDGRSVVVAGMDVSDEALDAFRKNVNPDARTTKSCDELCGMDDLDAVAVMSPEFTHEDYVLKAFNAGKHVFCEKPMAITTDGCDRMLRAWQESGKRFMVGFNMRYMNIFRVMKDIVESGTIGEVKVVWVRHFVGHGGRWYYHDWHGCRKNTTGLLLQKASHDIDMIHWITGQYGRRVVGMGSLDYYGGERPDELTCPTCEDRDTCVEYQDFPDRPGNKMNQCAFRREVDVEDNSSITMELDGGIKATYTQCHYTPDYCRNYTFIGTEGRVENLNDSSQVIVKLRDKSNRWTNLADRTYEVKPAAGGHGGADPLICRDFIDMIAEGKEPLATPLAGRMSVAVGCAATRSIRNGSVPVEIEEVPEGLREKVF